MRALAWLYVAVMIPLSIAFLAGVVPSGTVHFFGIVPMAMLGCVAMIFAVCRRG